MTVKWITHGLSTPAASEVAQLEAFADAQKLQVILEWKDGQYWLHSDQEKELPIGIEIDQILKRHEAFFKGHSLQKDLVARAIGLKGPYRPKILDLTGGLLGDTLLFLSFGCEVQVLERHPIVSFLIQSALNNAHHPALSRLNFKAEQAGQFLTSANNFDVIYFDPMFEDANEKALPKKEMRIFRSFVGSDQDAEEVFQKARSLKPKRLVVKRPLRSKALASGPQISFKGKATRYDVYLP